MSKFSDAELMAFLDGTISADRSEAIVAALGTDPALEDRLMALDDLGPVVRDAFEAATAERDLSALAVPATAGPSKPGMSRPWLAAAAVALLAITGTLTIFGGGPRVDPWMEQVAAYQALYSEATIAHVAADPADLAGQLDRAAQVLSINLPQAELESVAGLDLVRAQILEFEGRPLAQIVFADQAGQPIAFCIIGTNEAPSDRALSLVALQGMESAAFSSDAHAFFLIGRTDRPAIAGFAADFQAIFQKG